MARQRRQSVLAIIPVVLALLLRLAGRWVAAEGNMSAIVSAPGMPLVIFDDIAVVLGTEGNLAPWAVGLGDGLPDAIIAAPDLALVTLAVLREVVPVPRRRTLLMRRADFVELLAEVLGLAAEGLAASVVVASVPAPVVLAPVVNTFGTVELLARSTSLGAMNRQAARLAVVVIVPAELALAFLVESDVLLSWLAHGVAPLHESGVNARCS